MERLLSVRDIQERYQCNPATARRYIRQMEHIEKPLMVSERAVSDWEKRKLIMPDWMIRQEMKRRKIG